MPNPWKEINNVKQSVEREVKVVGSKLVDASNAAANAAAKAAEDSFEAVENVAKDTAEITGNAITAVDTALEPATSFVTEVISKTEKAASCAVEATNLAAQAVEGQSDAVSIHIRSSLFL